MCILTCRGGEREIKIDFLTIYFKSRALFVRVITYLLWLKKFVCISQT